MNPFPKRTSDEAAKAKQLMKLARSQSAHMGAIAIFHAWTGLIHLWAKAKPLRGATRKLWAEMDLVQTYLSELRRTLEAFLPKEILDELEGFGDAA